MRGTGGHGAARGAVWLRLICVLSLLMVGFGHRPWPAAQPGDPAVSSSPGSVGVDLSAYALPDGSLPYICLPPSSEGGEDGGLVYQGCDACRIVASFCLTAPIVLPEPTGVSAPTRIPRPDGWRLADGGPIAHDASPRAPPRA